MNAMKPVKLKQGLWSQCCKQVLKQGTLYTIAKSGAIICGTCRAAGVEDIAAVKV